MKKQVFLSIIVLFCLGNVITYAQTEQVPLTKSSGKLEYEDYIYEGEIENGKPNGKGKIIRKSGATYEGIFKNGLLQGMGKYTFGKDSYEGEFKDGTFDGIGKYISENGDVYEGEFKEVVRHGIGKYIWSNGDVYEGEFYVGRRTGIGKYIWNDGDIYEGGWKNDLRDGFGTMYYKSTRYRTFSFYKLNEKCTTDPNPENFSTIPIREYTVAEAKDLSQAIKIQFGERSAKVLYPNGKIAMYYRVNGDTYYSPESNDDLMHFIKYVKDKDKVEFSTKKVSSIFSNTSTKYVYRYNTPFRDVPKQEFAKYGIEFQYQFNYGKVREDFVQAEYRTYNAGKTYIVGGVEVQEKDYRREMVREASTIDINGASYVFRMINGTDKMYKINYKVSGCGNFQFYSNGGFLVFAGLKNAWNDYEYSNFMVLKPKEIFKDVLMVGSETSSFLFSIKNITEISSDWYNGLLKALETSDLGLIDKYLNDELAKEWHSKLKHQRIIVTEKNKKDFDLKYRPLVKTNIKPKDEIRFDKDFKSDIIYSITNSSDITLSITYDINGKIKKQIKLKPKESFTDTEEIMGVEKNALKVSILELKAE